MSKLRAAATQIADRDSQPEGLDACESQWTAMAYARRIRALHTRRIEPTYLIEPTQ